MPNPHTLHPAVLDADGTSNERNQVHLLGWLCKDGRFQSLVRQILPHRRISKITPIDGDMTVPSLSQAEASSNSRDAGGSIASSRALYTSPSVRPSRKPSPMLFQPQHSNTPSRLSSELQGIATLERDPRNGEPKSTSLHALSVIHRKYVPTDSPSIISPKQSSQRQGATGHFVANQSLMSRSTPRKDRHIGPTKPSIAKPEDSACVNSLDHSCLSCGMPPFQCRNAKIQTGANYHDFPTFHIRVEDRDHDRLLSYIRRATRRIPRDATKGRYTTLCLINRNGSSEEKVEVRVGLNAGLQKVEAPVVSVCQAKRVKIVQELRDLADAVKRGAVVPAYMVDKKGTMFGVLIARS
jgi:hypothetical protein